MKKTLAALAVLGAFAGTTMAANVTLYGVVDTGLRYTNTSTTETGVAKVSSDTFEMKSGQQAGNRFGLKGTEELGNGLVVGFNLENSFNADDGTLDASKRLFHRESILFVRGGFGEVAFGRTGALEAGTGTYNIFGSKASAFGNGWSDVTNDKKVFLGKTDRYDNTITYKSPAFAGVTVYAQASLKQANVNAKTGAAIDDQEGSSDADRYYGIGAVGNWGPAAAGLIVSQRDFKRADINANKDNDDALAVSGFGSYDFGVAKVFLAAQYFDQGKITDLKPVAAPTFAGSTINVKGYGVMLSATAPVLGGKAYGAFGYTDAETTDMYYRNVKLPVQGDVNVYQVAVGYTYPLSKRTLVYTSAGYMQQKWEVEDWNHKVKTTQVNLGLTHTF